MSGSRRSSMRPSKRRMIGDSSTSVDRDAADMIVCGFVWIIAVKKKKQKNQRAKERPSVFLLLLLLQCNVWFVVNVGCFSVLVNSFVFFSFMRRVDNPMKHALSSHRGSRFSLLLHRGGLNLIQQQNLSYCCCYYRQLLCSVSCLGGSKSYWFLGRKKKTRWLRQEGKREKKKNFTEGKVDVKKSKKIWMAKEVEEKGWSLTSSLFIYGRPEESGGWQGKREQKGGGEWWVEIGNPAWDIGTLHSSLVFYLPPNPHPADRSRIWVQRGETRTISFTNGNW